MSKAERLLLLLVLDGWCVNDSDYGESCFFCARRQPIFFPDDGVHAEDCTYVAARDYLRKQGILGEDGRPLVDLSQEG